MNVLVKEVHAELWHRLWSSLTNNASCLPFASLHDIAELLGKVKRYYGLLLIAPILCLLLAIALIVTSMPCLLPVFEWECGVSDIDCVSKLL